MKRQTKLIPEEQLAHAHTLSNQPLEFAGPEELLRHDALHTPVPPAIARRLNESIGRMEPAPRPWWRRLFGK